MDFFFFLIDTHQTNTMCLFFFFHLCIIKNKQVSLINFVASLCGASGIQAFKTMRTLRALRPLRAMARMQGMRVRYIQPRITLLVARYLLFFLI